MGHKLQSSLPLIAVDIGNTRMKVGLVPRELAPANRGQDSSLPVPTETLSLTIDQPTGRFEEARLTEWCRQYASPLTEWLVASVHRGATERLTQAVQSWSINSDNNTFSLRKLTYHDVPFAIHVDEPARVGIDRLMAAVAANQLRQRDRAAIVVDLGTAIKVDLVDSRGAFCGGAILPGIAMAARALEEQTDALPRIAMDHLEQPPQPLGKNTLGAIEAGLYWGAVGAVRELISQMSKSLAAPPDIFLTGGASTQVAALLDANAAHSLLHVPHLVLSGIALVGR